jgi:hypothetical protein
MGWQAPRLGTVRRREEPIKHCWRGRTCEPPG